MTGVQIQRTLAGASALARHPWRATVGRAAASVRMPSLPSAPCGEHHGSADATFSPARMRPPRSSLRHRRSTHRTPRSRRPLTLAIPTARRWGAITTGRRCCRSHRQVGCRASGGSASHWAGAILDARVGVSLALWFQSPHEACGVAPNRAASGLLRQVFNATVCDRGNEDMTFQLVSVPREASDAAA